MVANLLLRFALVLALPLIVAVSLSCTHTPEPAGSRPVGMPDPAGYRAHLMRNPHLEGSDGELFSWHARSGIGAFFQAYEAYGDPAWLHELGIYLDWLVDEMETEPDGYKGWVGERMGGDGELRGPHVVGDANLIEPMLQFAEVVLAGEDELSERFGEQARGYIELAEHVIEKWDQRGSWEVDGEFAVYTQQDQWVRADEPDVFVTVPELKRTENMNKSGKMGVVFLRLYRLTGEERWRERARKIFSQYKRIMRYFEDEDRYIFNFWEPFGPWDLDAETGHPLGWIAVHPFRSGYQAGEVGMMVEAYHTGIVFTEQDMQRLVRTNLYMWNGDLEDPEFLAADGRSDAGTLWSALADFDPELRLLQHTVVMRGDDSIRNRIARSHFENVVAGRPIGFDRRKVPSGDVPIIPDIPLYESRELNFAAAIPGSFNPADDETVDLATQVRGRGTLRITLYSGEERVAVLLEKDVDGAGDYDGRAGFKTLRWDGTVDGVAVPSGEYVVRWRLNDSLRERRLRIGAL